MRRKRISVVIISKALTMVNNFANMYNFNRTTCILTDLKKSKVSKKSGYLKLKIHLSVSSHMQSL